MNPSILITPNSKKAGKLDSIIPTDGTGDLDVVRATTATYVGSDGLIKTALANEPRFDYSNGSCPSILVEPQRTNLVLKSNAFSDAVWVKTNVTANDNNGIGIDGNLSASLITTSYTRNFLFQVFTCLPSTTYTFTFYVKRGTMTDLKYRFRDQTNNIDVIPVTSYYSQTNSTTFTRITVTLTTPAGCTSFRFSPIADTGSIGTCYITSAQIEAGSNATSYIPTVASTVTRNADSISRSNIYTNGLITSAGGTWYVELNNVIKRIRDNSSYALYLSTSLSGYGGNGFIIYNGTSNSIRPQIIKFVEGIANGVFNITTDNTKLAIKWNGVTADIFANGIKVVSSTAFTSTAMQFLGNGLMPITLNIKSTMLFPTPLSDSELIQLTTL